ncbi:MAG: ATP-binding protein [Spirochaetota bacterium]
MKRTLSTRVLGSYLLTAAAGIVVLGIVIGVVFVRDARERALRDLEGVALLAASLLTDRPSAPDVPDALAGDFTSLADSISFLTAQGSLLGGSPDPPPLPRATTRTEIIKEPLSGFSRTNGGRVFAYALAVAGDESNLVYVTRDRRRIDATTRPAIALVLASVIALIAVIALLVYRTLGWTKRSIYAIQAAARRYARGELEVHTRTNGPVELRLLGDDLNLMAEQLRSRIAAISEQRNQLEAILSSMLEGVVVLDGSRTIVAMNDAAGRLLCVSPSDARGRTLIESLRNVQLDELSELALGSDEPIERTVTLYRERPVHAQVHATPLRGESASRPTGTVLVMNDITRLKHLEDLRKDFVANVSHELKTPITSIKGFVETLLDDPRGDASTVQRFLQIILNHTNRLHLIIEDLLSLSRLEQNDERVAPQRFPLQSVIDQTLEICGPRADEKRIELSFATTGDDYAWGVPNLIEQALVNLVDNAIKYSPEGSTVSIDLANTARRLVIRVTDHGQGIRAQDLPRIFERFYRTDKARSRELGGTGLGLAIVKHIVRAHRGEVTVDSTLGQGSTFVVELPQDQATSAPSGQDTDYDLSAANQTSEQGSE